MKLTTTLSILSTMVLVSCGQSGKGKKSEAPAEDPQPENSPTAPTEAPQLLQLKKMSCLVP